MLDTYISFKAVMNYRIANKLYYSESDNLKSPARKITENAKLISGIEIHPGASIGKRFVVDHGIGTGCTFGE